MKNGRPRQTHCYRGHPYAKHAYVHVQGTLVKRTCRVCQNDNLRWRYRRDPAFREYKKAMAIASRARAKARLDGAGAGTGEVVQPARADDAMPVE